MSVVKEISSNSDEITTLERYDYSTTDRLLKKLRITIANLLDEGYALTIEYTSPIKKRGGFFLRIDSIRTERESKLEKEKFNDVGEIKEEYMYITKQKIEEDDEQEHE